MCARALAFMLVLTTPAVAADLGAQELELWRKALALEELAFEGGSALVSQTLRGNDEVVGKILGSFTRRWIEADARAAQTAAAFEDVIDRINRSLGVEPAPAWQAHQRMLAGLFDIRPAPDDGQPRGAPQVYLFDVRLAMHAMQQGGRLPGLAVDPTTAEVTYSVQRESGAAAEAGGPILIPVAPGDGAADTVFQMLASHLPRPSPAEAAWVIAEATLERTLSDADAPRWLVSGLASNAAAEALRGAGMREAADELERRVDAEVDPGEDLNLAQWLGPPLAPPIVTDEDRRLEEKRTAAAGQAVRGLKLADSPERVATIIAALRRRPADPTTAVASAVQGLTVERIDQALGTNRAPADVQAAEKRYGQAFVTAWRAERFEEAWLHLRRWMEIRLSRGEYTIDYYTAASEVLTKMGRPDAAFETLRQQVPVAARRAPQRQADLLALLLRSARESGRGAAVVDEARRYWELDPTKRWAGVMVVEHLLAIDRAGEARQVAQQILRQQGEELSEDERGVLRQALRP